MFGGGLVLVELSEDGERKSFLLCSMIIKVLADPVLLF